ncbi:MAG: amidophosphoribosyltransferase [Pseudomonadota bacterium]
MCGITGLLIKDPARTDRLGAWSTPMLTSMAERGPDSAGLAVFADRAGPTRFSLYAGSDDFDWHGLAAALDETLAGPHRVEPNGRYARLWVETETALLTEWLTEHFPAVHLLATGNRMDLYKDAGHPAAVAERYGFPGLVGSHAVGHTRMATESAVTPAHAHPFSAGRDFCLVHNGSLSNPHGLRRRLERRGIAFETDNDTEAACRYLQWRRAEGDDLETSLERGFTELDGFYTLLLGTDEGLALVRDPFACKPAVVAETDTYVAIGSEFRALAHLPDIDHAELYEPRPEAIYTWRT